MFIAVFIFSAFFAFQREKMSDSLRFLKLRSTAFSPTRGSANSAGLDLAAAEKTIVFPNDSRLVATGIKVKLYLY